MNKLTRYVACTFCSVALLCASAACLAQSPFNGTWHTNLAQTKFSRKPKSFYIGHGWYHCVSCHPAFTVPADGTFYAVSGQPFDMIRVSIDNPHAITVTARRHGNMAFKQTRTVSSSGRLLTVKTTVYPPSGSKPMHYTAVCRRQGSVPSDVQPTSGKWITERVSGSGMTTTLKVTSKQIAVSSPSGESFTAQFNGKKYPVTGSDYFNQVSLKRINAHTIEATDLRNGKVVEKDRMTVHGNTLIVAATREPSGRTTTFVAHKG